MGMDIRTVGVMSTGEMGHAVGNVLREGGLRVITCLRGRSSRTAALAARAGISDVPDYESLVRESDVLLSIVAPAQAVSLAERIATAVRATQTDLLFAECNAVAPQTVRRIGSMLTAARARFVDAGIIGPPPSPGSRATRFYVSGEHRVALTELNRHGLDVRPIGSDVGQASGLKMCYAALTKGLTALATELLVAGKTMGLEEPLRAELLLSQADLVAWLERQLPTMPPKATRWVGEMEQIAATFADRGLTPLMLEGAAVMYREIAQTLLGTETPEARRRGQTLDDVVAVLAERLAAAASAR